jgi:two-component SAPR family response regulator
MKRVIVLCIGSRPDYLKPLLKGLSCPYTLRINSRQRRVFHFLQTHECHLMLLVCSLATNALGRQFLKVLKQNFSELPVIFLTEEASKEFIVSVFRVGAMDLYEMPGSEAALKKQLNELLAETGSCEIQPEAVCEKKEHPWQKSLLAWAKQWQPAPRASRATLPKPQIDQKPKNTIEKVTANVPELIDQPGFVVHFFGSWQVWLNGYRCKTWPNVRTETLFAYLAFRHDQGVARDPNKEQEKSFRFEFNNLRGSLEQITASLRKIDPLLEPMVLIDESYRINPAIPWQSDVMEFERYWQRAQHCHRSSGVESALEAYKAAAALYQGDFMQDAMDDTWIELARDYYREIYLYILNQVSDYYAMDGNPGESIRLCERMLEIDNCREEVYRRMMFSHWRLGRIDLALETFKRCEQTLRKELAETPSATIWSYYQTLAAEEQYKNVKITKI